MGYFDKYTTLRHSSEQFFPSANIHWFSSQLGTSISFTSLSAQNLVFPHAQTKNSIHDDDGLVIVLHAKI
jgi:hypothetical protein